MSKAPPKKGDAVDLLDADHIAVKKMFQEFKKLAEDEAPAEERKALADKICMELTIHTQLEEEIFYPEVRAEIDDDLMMNEAEVEHASAKELISQISSMSANEEKFNAKVVVLGEYIDHHVKEEREEMFPEARKTSVDLVAMAQRLATRKEELQQQYETAEA